MKGIRKIIAALALIAVTSTSMPVFATERYSNLEDLKNSIYNHMMNRDSTFSFYYTGNNAIDLLKEVSEENDYLERSISKFETYTSSTECIVKVYYRTTKEQEDYIDSQLKTIVYNLIDPRMNESERVVAINNYIVKLYNYDDTLQSDNVYSALTTKTTTCQGYAMTAYKMFKYAGIETRLISGTMKGTPHGWNLVKIAGNWYHIDSTNNDNIIRDKYLLKSDDFMRKNQFAWDSSKYPAANNDYYSEDTEYIDRNNDKETDRDASYSGGYWSFYDNGWYFKRGSGYTATGWFKNKGSWYYLGDDGRMRTGWIYDKGNWYYCWSDGTMATNTVVDGYKLNENGAWVE